MLHHHVAIGDRFAHLFEITLTVPDPGAEVELALPVWIPGSYLVRDFARHWQGLQARQGGSERPVERLDTARWRVRCRGGRPLVLQARVYAFDTSVRAAFLDADRGFFNGSSLLLRVVGREAEAQRLTLGGLPEGWEVATAMPADGDGGWRAADYDELVDHPFELGSFWRGTFEAGGVPHELVVSGAWPRFDGDRLLRDAQRICAQQIAFWHGEGGRPPFDRYVFLLQVVDDGYGGLEHRASTALVAGRRDLPVAGAPPGEAPGDGYVTLLGLISHEYFHAWHVKRLRPADLVPLDYQRQNPTELLWCFEGFTSYYDDLMLCRAGLIEPARYLKLLARTVNAVAAGPGERVQSLAEASWDAWIKYYRPDENSPNATVSYYQKGALLALLLDQRLRDAGSSLDVLMRRLWRGGRAAPVTEAALRAAVRALAGPRAGAALARDLSTWVQGREPLPLDGLWAACGVAVRSEPAGWAAQLGLRLSEGALSGVQVKAVLAGSPAQAAGVAPGDELLAVDGWRIRRLDDARAWVAPDTPFELLVSRGQRLRALRLVPRPGAAATPPVLSLAPADDAAEPARSRRTAWLGG